MSDNSAIEWTTHTFNPWWGCSRVSPGCVHCYADDQAKRYGHDVWRRHGLRRMLSDANWARPLKWNRDAERAGEPAKVFCASMADVFEDHPDVAEPRKRLWGLIESTPWLIWQLLTKRPENIAGMVPWGRDWPPSVWIGASAETQRWADTRIPYLLDTPARVRFLSCEPLLGPINLSRWVGDGDGVPTEPRGRPVSSRGERPANDRLRWSHMAACDSAENEQREDRHDPLPPEARGERYREIPASAGDVRGRSSARTGSPAGLAPLQRPDSGWPDGQSQERPACAELAVEPRTGDLPGAGCTCSSGTAPWATGSARVAQCDGEADHGAGAGDLLPARIRRAVDCDSDGLRHSNADSLEDRPRRAPIAWLILGGESGPKARPMDLTAVRSLIRQGHEAGAAVFVKQLGSVLGRQMGTGSKGGDWDAWPADLRIREFPAAVEPVTA